MSHLPRYDPHQVNEALVKICDYYCGGHRSTGKRLVYSCPECKDPKFEVLLDTRGANPIGGCLRASCSVPESENAVMLIAYFENIGGNDRAWYPKTLKKGYKILGLPEPGDHQSVATTITTATTIQPGQRRNFHEARSGTHAQEPTSVALERPLTANPDPSGWILPKPPPAATAVSTHRPPSQNTREQGPTRPEPVDGGATKVDYELIDQVYVDMMKMCKLEKKHFNWWSKRGLTEETIEKGGFGSLSKRRIPNVEARLLNKYGDDLLKVPGFYRPQNSGDIIFSLREEYTLIPYHDACGKITTIEGRAISKAALEKSKYRTPTGGGNHLYIFPGFQPTELVAFCEGPIGAIVAAQYGIPVAAIQGIMRYRNSTLQDAPVQEILGQDFSGRKIAYIPDLDSNPRARADVVKHLPDACDYLISRQNGSPEILILPRGKDLDEYLLSVQKTGDSTASNGDSKDPKTAFEDLLEHTLSLEEGVAKIGADLAVQTTLKRRPANPQQNPLEAAVQDPDPVAQYTGSTTSETSKNSGKILDRIQDQNAPRNVTQNYPGKHPDFEPEFAQQNGDGNASEHTRAEAIATTAQANKETGPASHSRHLQVRPTQPDVGAENTTGRGNLSDHNGYQNGSRRTPSNQQTATGLEEDRDREDAEVAREPSIHWGFPRRRPVLDYSAPDLPSEVLFAAHEFLMGIVAALITLIASVLIPIVIPEVVKAILTQIRFLELAGSAIATPLFPPLASLVAGAGVLLVVSYQRRDLRRVRRGNP